jgi:uncharacterized protein YcfJ
MKAKLSALIAASMLTTPVLLPTAAHAQYQERYYNGDTHRYEYRYHCKKSSGTTGAVAGGVGGAVVGNALGGGVLGTVAGGVGGALLGKHLDKKHDAAQNRKNGC